MHGTIRMVHTYCTSRGYGMKAHPYATHTVARRCAVENYLTVGVRDFFEPRCQQTSQVTGEDPKFRSSSPQKIPYHTPYKTAAEMCGRRTSFFRRTNSRKEDFDSTQSFLAPKQQAFIDKKTANHEVLGEDHQQGVPHWGLRLEVLVSPTLPLLQQGQGLRSSAVL